jgi:hypothetical protein
MIFYYQFWFQHSFVPLATVALFKDHRIIVKKVKNKNTGWS